MPVGQPKMGGSWWRDLTECGPLEKGMANHFSILVRSATAPVFIQLKAWDIIKDKQGANIDVLFNADGTTKMWNVK